MKNVILFIAICISLASCSFVKDVQSHCQVSQKSLDVQNGSFETCLTCDSLASVVKAQIAKAQKK